jgi:ADP-ribosylation factor GTPase-activating protein 2/3
MIKGAAAANAEPELAAAARTTESNATTTTTSTANNRANAAPQTGLGTARASTRRPASARRPAGAKGKGGSLGATRKKGGLGGGGLGAKKITQNVDRSLFDQAPEAPPTVIDPVAPEVRSLNMPEPQPVMQQQQQSTSHNNGAPVGDAFFDAAQEEEEEERKPVNLRGTDGHVSISKLMNSKQSGGSQKTKTNRLGMGRGMGRKANNPNRSSANSTAEGAQIQSRFGDSKGISSKQYFGTSEQDDFERRQRLSKFQGATSISSADYHGNGPSSGGGNDETDASELMGRLSVQAKMDMENMKNLASQAKSKLFSFAKDMHSRYG